MNEEQASLLRLHCPGDRSDLRMPQLENLPKPNLHQQCKFVSGFVGLDNSQIWQILDERRHQRTHSVTHHLLVFSDSVDLGEVLSSHGSLVRVASLYLF